MSYVFPSPERPIPFDHMMYEHLQKWGPRKQEVKFYLRHEDSPTESSDQGENTPSWLVIGHVLPTTAFFSLADSGRMFFIPFSVASNIWKKETSTSWPNNVGFCLWFNSVVLFTKWIKVALKVSVPSNNTEQGKVTWEVYHNKIISITIFKMKKYWWNELKAYPKLSRPQKYST